MTFDYCDAEPRAREYFLASCGFRDAPDTPKYRRMRKCAEDVLAACRDRIRPSAAVVRIDEPSIQGETLTVNGETFECRVFGRFEPSEVRTAWAYIATAGDVHIGGDNIAEQVLADLWGTAFTDAAADMVRDSLTPSARLTPSFGPGFYGMGLDQLPAFVRLTCAADVGVRLSRGGMLLPQKSCAGFIFDTAAAELPARDCASCIGNKGGCRQCKNAAK